MSLFKHQFHRNPTPAERAFAALQANRIADIMHQTGARYERAREIALCGHSLQEFRVCMYILLDSFRGPPTCTTLRAAAKRLEAEPQVTMHINLQELGL